MPIIKLKGTSPLKENVSQNAIKEPQKKCIILVLILVLIKA